MDPVILALLALAALLVLLGLAVLRVRQDLRDVREAQVLLEAQVHRVALDLLELRERLAEIIIKAMATTQGTMTQTTPVKVTGRVDRKGKTND